VNRTIFLIDGSEQLVELREQLYDSEDLLQRLLATHPSLLAGDQINRTDPRRWLLIRREAGIPGEEGGSDRWSIDHLFLDQDAIPTLVEVKRSSDTRIRREVVGQMLDYAANAVVYWPVEYLRAQFEGACAGRNLDPEQELASFLGPEEDPSSFWQQAKTNLQAGKVRLVFVADEIPSELRRIVEFLNQQMDPAEVLAVEIKQYTGEGLRTLVPTLIGQTAEAQQRKGTPPAEKRQWDELSFFQHLAERCSSVEVTVARRILEWARPRTEYVWWGKGRRLGSFIPVYMHDGTNHPMFAVWTSGSIEIYFYWYARRRPFDDEAKRLELLEQLNTIPGVSLPVDSIDRRPSIPLKVFVEERNLHQLFSVFEGYIESVQML
jgi:hypothetical protein